MKNTLLATLLASPILLAASAALATPPFPKEEDLLKDVKVAEGMEVVMFSAPPQSNYPVFIAASPDGTLFVSSDGNGSLGRDANRGRILRLRDTDGDGRADEVKEFAKVDSPRGLLVDGNAVICMHPPDLSAFIDKDGDGVSDEKKVLVTGLAFDLKGRPADHTTNGIEMGVDGYIYIAVGDFGFMEATGSDGRKLQLRGGGIVRVRPDGSGMDLYSRGTRNILEVEVSPLLDAFTRDNTNDGGGWDLRLHHFGGFEDHGYPRLYKNFGDEIIKPLADYGGGSGCGGFWLDEPGWPAEWNNLPYTSDWGKGPIFRQPVRPKGATFEESGKPEPLVKMTRSTDGDVDAAGRVYASSWRGATFNWAGPEAGYIVRIQPKGHKPAAVPDFAKAPLSQLVKLLESASHRTRMEAQRELLRRDTGATPAKEWGAVYALAADAKKPLATRVAALYGVRLRLGAKAKTGLEKLAADPTIASWAVRALGEIDGLDAASHAVMLAALRSEDARLRKEAVIALGRAHGLTGVWADAGTAVELKAAALDAHATAIAPLLADSDPVVAHTAMQVLRQLKAGTACFAALDDGQATTPMREGALMVLRGIHDAKTVDGLIARLAKATDTTQRQKLFTALCRLHFIEGKWKGDSWGTRPDTRGPFYQPEEWAESKKISAALAETLTKAKAEEMAAFGNEFKRHRIKLDASPAKLVELAAKDPSLLPSLARQLADGGTIPAGALPLLAQLAADAAADDESVGLAVLALARTDSAESAKAALAGLANLDGAKRKKKDIARVRDAFFSSRLVENQHQLIEAEAEKLSGPVGAWADAALLKLAAKKIGSPEPREMAGKALDAGWQHPKRREQIIRAAIIADDRSRAAQIAAALSDPEKSVAVAAADAVKKLKLDPAKLAAESKPAGPLIATLKLEDVLAQVMATKGDASRGEQLFTSHGCVACHTVKQGDAPRGPFLGHIADTYKRRELAEAVLLPNKTIAQGFVTNVFTLKDGSQVMGFVTLEASEKVVIRDIAAQERTIATSDITKREKSDRSMMPEGLAAGMSVKDLASLLDYLESLAKK